MSSGRSRVIRTKQSYAHRNADASPHGLGGFAGTVVGSPGHLSPLSAPGCAPPAPELAHRPHDAHVGDIQVPLRDFKLRVPEEHLDLADVEAVFKPPRRALVSQVMPV